jgi:uncharacterized membrane protein
MRRVARWTSAYGAVGIRYRGLTDRFRKGRGSMLAAFFGGWVTVPQIIILVIVIALIVVYKVTKDKG